MRLLSTSVAFTCKMRPKNAKIQNLFSITFHSFFKGSPNWWDHQVKIFFKRHIFSCKLIHLFKLPLNLLIVQSSFFFFSYLSRLLFLFIPSFQKIINSIGGAVALEPLIDFSRRDFEEFERINKSVIKLEDTVSPFASFISDYTRIIVNKVQKRILMGWIKSDDNHMDFDWIQVNRSLIETPIMFIPIFLLF